MKEFTPDPKKVEDIINMPTPQDKRGLQCFLGMATSLANHIPNFSAHTCTMRHLIKKEIPFEWTKDHQQSFNKVKNLNSCSKRWSYWFRKQSINFHTV